MKWVLEKYGVITHPAPRINRLTGNRLLYALDPSRHQPKEPIWQDYRHIGEDQLPENIRCWLLDAGSLTEHLIRASEGDFKVQIISQARGLPRPSEARLLDLTDTDEALIRQVLLVCKNQPWVFARSVIPESSMTGRLSFLRDFDDKPLGQMIFNDPTMVRQPFEIARVNVESGGLPDNLDPNREYWGRRSRFELSGQPLMVSEIFLKHFDAQFNPIAEGDENPNPKS